MDKSKYFKHYVSLMVDLGSNQAQQEYIRQGNKIARQRIKRRYKELMEGKFDHLQIPLDVPGGLVFPRSYSAAGMISRHLNADEQIYLKPNEIRKSGFKIPVLRLPKQLFQNYTPKSLHVTVLPVTGFENKSALNSYLKLFRPEFDDFTKELVSVNKLPFNVNLTSHFKMLTNPTEDNYFLGMMLDQESKLMMKDISSRFGGLFNQLNEPETRDLSSRNTEINNHEYHATVSLAKDPHLFAEVIGEAEIHFINELLLLPRDQIIQKYGTANNMEVLLKIEKETPLEESFFSDQLPLEVLASNLILILDTNCLYFPLK